MHPSIGALQLPCRSHYLSTIVSVGSTLPNGTGRVIVSPRSHIRWVRQWSDGEIACGRRSEEKRRQIYYAALEQDRRVWVRILEVDLTAALWPMMLADEDPGVVKLEDVGNPKPASHRDALVRSYF